MSLVTAITIALWPVIGFNIIVSLLNVSGRAPWLGWDGKSLVIIWVLMNLSLFGLALSMLLVLA